MSTNFLYTFLLQYTAHKKSLTGSGPARNPPVDDFPMKPLRHLYPDLLELSFISGYPLFASPLYYIILMICMLLKVERCILDLIMSFKMSLSLCSPRI